MVRVDYNKGNNALAKKWGAMGNNIAEEDLRKHLARQNYTIKLTSLNTPLKDVDALLGYKLPLTVYLKKGDKILQIGGSLYDPGVFDTYYELTNNQDKAVYIPYGAIVQEHYPDGYGPDSAKKHINNLKMVAQQQGKIRICRWNWSNNTITPYDFTEDKITAGKGSLEGMFAIQLPANYDKDATLDNEDNKKQRRLIVGVVVFLLTIVGVVGWKKSGNKRPKRSAKG